jgi:hypothetical protein
MAVVGLKADSAVELEGAVSETNAVAGGLEPDSGTVEEDVAVKGTNVVAELDVVEVGTCVDFADTAADFESVASAVGLEAGSVEGFADAVDAGTDCEPVTVVVDSPFDCLGGSVDMEGVGLVAEVDLTIGVGRSLFVSFPWPVPVLVGINPLFILAVGITDANLCVLTARRFNSDLIFLPKASLLSPIGVAPPFANTNPPPLIATIFPPPDAGSIE